MTATTGRTGFARRSEILEKLALSSEELNRVQKSFPVRWPAYYLNLIEDDPKTDPVALMGRPDLKELETDAGDLEDAVSDRAKRPVPFVVRKHRDRVIILTAKQCHFYCRFCFRREEPVNASAQPGPEDWDRIEHYLRTHPEIEEAILSGGDPLTLSDAALAAISSRLDRIPSIKKRRIHTRAPVHYPERVTAQLLDGLMGRKPLRLVIHANHPREVTDETQRISRLCAARDIQMLNQAVLLRGVNDDPETQLQLWRKLEAMGIHAHHLHHPDRVAGNAGFRLSLEAGLAVYNGFRGQLKQPPTYVLDLPDGSGKVPVLNMEQQPDQSFSYEHPDGSRSVYSL